VGRSNQKRLTLGATGTPGDMVGEKGVTEKIQVGERFRTMERFIKKRDRGSTKLCQVSLNELCQFVTGPDFPLLPGGFQTI